MGQTEKKYNSILVFGVFDGFHEGHRFFLEQAKHLANTLVVVVTQDAMVEKLKHKTPQNTLGQRINAVRETKIADTILAGDLIEYSWSSVRLMKPDAIAIGYDQKKLRAALETFQKVSPTPFDIVIIDPHHPEKFKTSILHKEILENQHTLEERYEARRKEKQKRLDKGEYLADFVYGANDGIITTFAVVTGAVGASLSPGVVVILGIANLIADGFSMGASSYLSLTSERNFHKSIRFEQEKDIETQPDVAGEEVRSVLHKWHVPSDLIDPLLRVFTRDKKRWTDFIMENNFNISEEDTSNPVRHGLATFTAFVIVGFLPLFPYVFGLASKHQFLISIIATALALFFTGAAQSLLTKKKWWLKTGTQMLVVGGVAAAFSYSLGFLLKTVFGVIV